MKIAKTLGLCGLFAAASMTYGQAILVPDSTSDDTFALDPATGDVLGSFDMSAYASTPINVIDGPNGTLLLSDQIRDMIFELDSAGTLIGDYITAPIDNLRGIHRFPNGIVAGATTTGMYAWGTDGNIRSEFIDGDFFDVNYLNNLVIGTDIDDDNVQAYNFGLVLVGETTPGGVDFPEQCAAVRNPSTGQTLLAVASFTPDTVYFFDAGGNLVSSFPILGGASGRGVIQLPSGNLLVSDSSNGVVEYTFDGTVIRTILSGTGFRYLELCRNYRP